MQPSPLPDIAIPTTTPSLKHVLNPRPESVKISISNWRSLMIQNQVFNTNRAGVTKQSLDRRSSTSFSIYSLSTLYFTIQWQTSSQRWYQSRRKSSYAQELSMWLLQSSSQRYRDTPPQKSCGSPIKFKKPRFRAQYEVAKAIKKIERDTKTRFVDIKQILVDCPWPPDRVADTLRRHHRFIRIKVKENRTPKWTVVTYWISCNLSQDHTPYPSAEDWNECSGKTVESGACW